jgi:hypothetical protein
MSGQDKAPLQPVEKALRAGVLNIPFLLELVSNSVTVTPGAAAAAGASLQDWVEYRMPDEVRFKENDRGRVGLEKITTSRSASGPIAALAAEEEKPTDWQHWQQKKKSTGSRGELGREIEQRLQEDPDWMKNLVHDLFCEDYNHWCSQFETVESLVQWYDYLRDNPDAEDETVIVAHGGLHLALDKLEPSATDVFKGHVETHYRKIIAELLHLSNTIDDMLTELKTNIGQQVKQDKLDMDQVLTKAITTEMIEFEIRLKDMLATSTRMIMQETKNWLCMYVCMYVCMGL